MAREGWKKQAGQVRSWFSASDIPLCYEDFVAPEIEFLFNNVTYLPPRI